MDLFSADLFGELRPVEEAQGRETAIPPSEWEWFGGPGHFIASFNCHWHLCTRVGEWLVSSVGEYLPSEVIWESLAEEVPGAWEKIAPLRGDARLAAYLKLVGFRPLGSWMPELGDREKPLYETTVFWLGRGESQRCPCGCGRPRPISYRDVWRERSGDPEKARAVHAKACERAARGEFQVPLAAEIGEASKEEEE